MPGKKKELPTSPFPFDETMRRALMAGPAPAPVKAKKKRKAKKPSK